MSEARLGSSSLSNSKGKVQKAEIAESSNNPLIDSAAVKLSRSLEFMVTSRSVRGFKCQSSL